MTTLWISHNIASFNALKANLHRRSEKACVTGYVGGSLRCMTLADLRDITASCQVVAHNGGWAACVWTDGNEVHCSPTAVTPVMKSVLRTRSEKESALLSRRARQTTD